MTQSGWRDGDWASRAGPEARKPRRGAFTLIELMVVMAIIVLAAGIMTPTIAEFFRNRALDGVKGELSGVFSRARLQAVTQGRDISVVFFREGLRIYDELNKTFADGGWTGDSSRLGRKGSTMWYILGCSDDLSSVDPGFDKPDRDKYKPRSPYVPPYPQWAGQQASLRRRFRTKGLAVRDDQFDISNLVKVTFHRDGTLSFGVGSSDVRSADFSKNPPANADIKLYQLGNTTAAFVDLRLTGQVRSRLGDLSAPPARPSGPRAGNP